MNAKTRYEIQTAAGRALARQIACGAEHYDRARQLPRLLPLMPSEIRGGEPACTRAILLRLAKALRTERRLGRAGHWTYDLNRHIALVQAWRAERDRLRGLG